MTMHANMGAMCSCTFGVAPGTLMVLPQNRVLSSNKPAANIMDNKPFANILPFGMCNSLANPMVAAATAAAFGVLTPMPCVPMIAAPWIPTAPTTMVGTAPGLNNTSKLMCNWGGVIQMSMPGQFMETIS